MSVYNTTNNSPLMPTKSEILITRGCNLMCHYCGMTRYVPRQPKDYLSYRELSDKHWSNIPKKLKELGIEFAPIYGAEPLTRMPALINFIKEATNQNILTTVITNGVLLMDNIDSLKSSGLDSITLSHDIESDDRYSKIKSEMASNILPICKKIFSDVELIVTLNKTNIDKLVKFILDNQDTWIHFDFQHFSRGQQGSKCIGTEPVFTDRDSENLIRVLNDVLNLKKQGYKIHPSEEILNMLISNPNFIINLNWKCEGGAWITIDSNGNTLGCDDYTPNKFWYPILKYGETWDWDSWIIEWNSELKKCPGCCWITHQQACLWSMSKNNNWKGEMTHGRHVPKN